MVTGRVVVTGGAGFVGSHLVPRLVDAGWDVRVLDSLEPQVHGASVRPPAPGAEYRWVDVTDADALDAALDGAIAVVHLAAQVGVGQSMYEVARYVRDNALGTAVLWEAIARRRDQTEAVVVASSMSLYGEGQYRCSSCDDSDAPVDRSSDALRSRQWEPQCLRCGNQPQAIGTSERKRLDPTSVYAVTKRDQEELSLVLGRAYGVRTVALRFFNIYGPHQSLTNPYTGVAAIFASRLIHGAAPVMFEDGGQTRDFVHVSDAVRAIELALSQPQACDLALNVGTGRATSVARVAALLAEGLGVDVAPIVDGRFRAGDIRHCIADITAAREVLGYEPEVDVVDGFADLAHWLREEAPPSSDGVDQATSDLVDRGLVI